ncbi:hypothetical protein GRAQ_03918 [Rahnella aquatilis CIP 78.65 = ATCC 33071]|uniref:DUF2442 domain-containing protein n=1 Tax=Rahnella aquatilis (strain ATCC 33071 / DSM 4594 / JCM 1683 / NBRC 105701 / NCIMB 13365 / CIP 78.65) TaxID=745277 RepID=H2IQE6_RAHAC|nr:DUF2442 domain-containing protein [Rahnella aquatilis]AEX50206.1 Protein of unknown function (DUF3532) [Rahnella aquatilis CIP 78.65 = ATCC 33071]KFD01072.1 hypothetical protein GRAQ_03918 [Rahnella aquatilis CIP 78.65 = ATCC 33071]
MNISPKSVRFDESTMWVTLEDGQILTVPLAQFPALLNATPAQRQDCETSAYGLHWDALDEDISIEGLIVGKPIAKPATHTNASALSAR